MFAVGWALPNDLFDITDEAHLQHTVGFIQHQRADLANVQGLFAQMILQATGCATTTCAPEPKSRFGDRLAGPTEGNDFNVLLEPGKLS